MHTLTRQFEVFFLSRGTTRACGIMQDLCRDTSSCISFTEHVTAYVDYVSFYDPLVELKLCSPSNTCSYILTKQKTSSTLAAKQVRRKWTFMSVQFWGEDPEGIWTLSMDVNTYNVSLVSEGNFRFLHLYFEF